ncbi:MAG: AmmeMemoRadiSam system radical SAM enzyme [Planctomycetaceae bacterium]|nr:AmmeMemoRadiSam system radical SAM enzyme [Planctomycetaceae bacterium]
MLRVVTTPPADGLRADGTLSGGWWHDDPATGRIVCDLCPRACSLKPGDRGFCFVRQNLGGEMVLTTFGRSTGFCIDPIEKKPLNHFYPGTSVLSFGTAGCNLGCKFCQNWDISKSREIERLSEVATPEAIAEAARKHGCRSVAFTYNDPVIWAEYAIETARACRAAGIQSVAVTAGYITPAARGPFYQVMDAANVDLKGFTEDFYRHITYSHLQPVLDTLEWLKKETDVWFEITNLVIPQANDAMDDIRRMCQWILEHCGDQVPLHFTAFHPDFRMLDRPRTPHETLLRAHEVARREGLKFVYTGNVNDAAHQSTYCPHCGTLVIERDWYTLGVYHLRGDRCGSCGGHIPGHFDERPGTWGRKRVPVEIARAVPGPQVVPLNLPSHAMKPTTGSAEPAIPAPARDALLSRLTPEQHAPILSAAAEFVAAAIQGRSASLPDPALAGGATIPVTGAYVTLKRQGHLRACCGFLGESPELIEALFHACLRTATEDHRLPPLSATELPYLDLSVNLLFNLKPVQARGRDRVEAVQVGRHGLRIHRGDASGLLLPGVAVEHGWDSESFLRHVCHKAGLPTTAWVDDATDLFTFESVEFGGPYDATVLGPDGARADGLLAPREFRQLTSHARDNLLALASGLTPIYYVPGIPDGTHAGLMLTVDGPDGDEPRHYLQLSLRPGVPLQATLFRLCEHAAQVLRQAPAGPRAIRVGLTILAAPAMQGTFHDPDLRGLDPAQRALLAMEHDKSAMIFAPTSSPEDLLEAMRGQIRPLNPERVGLISLAARSTESEFVFRSVPSPVTLDGTRPPAMAGRFYPDDPADLARMVDGLLAASERRPEPWPAAMVPHAGLIYSGKLAAAVFHRLEIPEQVIVIGPKHTRLGVDWAVAPHETWSIPGATIPADPALARALAAAIPGLQLDAAAHRQEHAIEVELPFLARLAPRTRVVGMVVGGGNWERCRLFAHGLAEVVRGLPSRPLLVISSDMNHFATDRENRQLDEIALRAMGRLDPAHLLATVNEHNISMCGVLPAVIVMECLRLLGGLQGFERVGYATSADVSGDTSRVVGYAGVLLK